jgi:sugar lactone lactonase YvrE
MLASVPTQGVFDGLCMDGVGNIWVARWSDQRVIGYRPDGSIICYIYVKGAYSPTIPCFGGELFPALAEFRGLVSPTRYIPN